MHMISKDDMMVVSRNTQSRHAALSDWHLDSTSQIRRPCIEKQWEIRPIQTSESSSLLSLNLNGLCPGGLPGRPPTDHIFGAART